MPTRSQPWPAGTPCWIDLSAPDLGAAKEFYGAVFGWSFLDLGPDFFNARTNPQRRVRNHVRELQALGYTVTLSPAA